MKYRKEIDTMGVVDVQSDKLWGAQTQRSINNFKIGPKASMPLDIIYAFAIIKKAAAFTNHKLGILEEKKRNLISQVCDEILAGKHDDQFPLVVWQTGSGTHTNMNINEVIANRAQLLSGKSLTEKKKIILPNDDVNKSQSSNDTFPTAMHIASYIKLMDVTLPAVKKLRETLNKKSKEFKKIVKIGRTHFMDATPLTLGQEFSGYVSQIDHAVNSINNSLEHLSELAIGGTAVGTGLNSPEGYDTLAVKFINQFTGYTFVNAKNKFEALASNDAFVETHNSLKQLAVSLYKIANDIRIMASGPRSGIGELITPANEPGSSIMPGKVNPSQSEALTMVCTQVIGNDSAITFGGSQGHFELNVFKPVIIKNFLESAQLIGDATLSFEKNCISDLKANKKQINKLLNNSLMLVTALNTKIGYYKAAEIANAAHKNGTTLRDEAINSGYLTSKEYDSWVNPENMTEKGKLKQ